MKTRNFILSMIALCSMTMAQAQKTDVMTATLQHGDNVTVFTTQTAFADAYAAAVDGDVITLSPGTFNATNLTKSVNIYGSGFEENETDGTGFSKINGSITIGVTNETLKDVHIEGIYILGGITNNSSSPLENIYFKKCYIRDAINIRSEITKVTFCDCYTGIINGLTDIMANNLLVTNCYVNGCVRTFQNGSTVMIDHCIITGTISHWYSGNAPADLTHSAFTWKNCIFTTYVMGYNGEYQRVGIGAVAYNCIYIQTMGLNSNLYTGYDLISVDAVSDIFSDANNANYSAERTFTLQHPDEWIGEDDTEIGIRGGLYPWNKVPATPVVKSLQLDVDGTNLNVTFDAETR